MSFAIPTTTTLLRLTNTEMGVSAFHLQGEVNILGGKTACDVQAATSS